MMGQRQSHSFAERKITKCVQENWEETGDSSAHVLKQDHCQK